MKTAIAAGLAACGAVVLAVPAHAETFIICPDGRTGVATTVTSCAFAHNVRLSWLSQSGPVVLAYSPVTGQLYNMQCQAGFTSEMLTTGISVDSVRCVGGDNAVVIVW